MALNPLVFTERVGRSFLRYQLTVYRFADTHLRDQMRGLLSLDRTRQTPLLKGPYISLSRSFRHGATVDDLIGEGIFHPHMRRRIPEEIINVYGHQEQAIRAIHEGRTTLVSTGTGSGKTECFLYPIISKCLELKDEGVRPGISAVIVYPMNALAEDQLGRLRGLLAGTGIPFGMYVGKTPDHDTGVVGIRLPPGSTRAAYEKKLAEIIKKRRGETVFPPEEICSREAMRTPGKQPRILLTNVKQLELLLTRQTDVELFANARLDFLVFDEAHTFSGAQGAETACLIRRLRRFCGREARDTVCVATSATIVDEKNPSAAEDFASRFFGVPRDHVETVGEQYEAEVWGNSRAVPPAPDRDPASLLAECVEAVDHPEDPDKAVQAVYRDLAGKDLGSGERAEQLHRVLSENELVFQVNEALAAPRALEELLDELPGKVGRDVSEAELLCWLTLGAAARKDGRPLLRPVVHGFVRGISGAVVSFPAGEQRARLWLAAEDEIEESGDDTKQAHFPVTTCTTCGQHYFIAFLKDFEFSGKEPGGGEVAGDGHYWEPLAEEQGGKRVVLTDRIVGDADDEDIESERTVPLYFCRYCGAAHPETIGRCAQCSATADPVVLHAIRQKKDNPGYLTSCLSCGSNGRRIGSWYREPARPVRATNVADVYVLAQDMIHHSERPRLLVFCDNRQDAAFQAGWMKDHARRFRLRALMAQGIKSSAVSIGDLTFYLNELLEKDEVLSRALIPEVWQVVRKEGGGGRHEQERRKFLRIQVLREVTLSSRQSIGLEPWGRIKVEYEGLDPTHPFIQAKASWLGLPAEDFRDGVASLLDYFRRKRILHDPEKEIFSKYWMDGDLEVQQGYLPQLGGPAGTKMQREPDEKPGLVTQWMSTRGETTVRQIVKKWGVPTDRAESFMYELFDFLTSNSFLVPVRLKGSKGKPLPNVSEVYQVNADLLRLIENHGVWQCRSCRRRITRRTPFQKCPAWRCVGDLEFIPEEEDNYDLQLLDQGYSMLRPAEHTAMVPHGERERIENLFKGESEVINALVCTPTLELGVDIGKLDAILMRNVPPLPANYWQRAGRAGRRHRMAVDLTYCRPLSHDRAYFNDPVKMLAGRIDPPAFNLRNELMVAKHVHAAVIARLHQYSRDQSRSETERQTIEDTLRLMLPVRVSAYLFERGELLQGTFDLTPLKNLIDFNIEDLLSHVEGAFNQGWPDPDKDVTSTGALRKHVTGMVDELDAVIRRLRRRLTWAIAQIKRLNEIREKVGTLEPEDDAHFKRCDRMIKRLKGTDRRKRREAEGYGDVNTFGVLAAEGFLPGYGLETGSVLGTAEIPYWQTGAMEFALPRPPSVALREYVPGNLIYANSNRFVARRFHRDVDEDRFEMPCFEVSVERQAIKETNIAAGASSLGAHIIQAISVCDVELVHRSHISDEEEFRFQMGVSVFGKEKDLHGGGVAFRWGTQDVRLRRGVQLRLVNVGASKAIELSQRFGYPVCTVCGMSVSPLASKREHEHFEEIHGERCGRKPDPVGFYADITADVLSLPACESQTVAYSVLEAIRFGATRVLDMHLDDLQILVIGHVERDEVDGLLWDPMPGGSGLLDQIRDRFGEILSIAREVIEKCPSACAGSCIDCLQTFRNAYYHKFLDRIRALEKITEFGTKLTESHSIPPRLPSKEPEDGQHPVNEAERKLRYLLKEGGFEEGIRGEQLKLDRSIGTTTPDIIYRADYHDEDEGVCIYLDGLSRYIHGNPETAEKDQLIRSWLRNNGYDVIEIAVSDLDDEGAMIRHFRKLAGYLQENELRTTVKSDSSWFERGRAAALEPTKQPFRRVDPEPGERNVKCLPLLPLKAAAGGFGDPTFDPGDECEWVEIETHHTLRAGMFVAQVEGKSMEPAIPDGSYCLFRAPIEGSRNGRVVLVSLSDEVDAETGERFTVKRYESEKVDEEDGTWRHVEVRLLPNNKEFEAITLKDEVEGRVAVVAEMIEVLG